MITFSLRITATGGVPLAGLAGHPAGRPRRPAPSGFSDRRGATPRARPAAELDDFPPERGALPPVALATAAARGFAAGNGYLTGQLVDRSA